MERHAQGRQLDLLEPATTAIQRQRLDPMMRTELTGLLKLLIIECSAAIAKPRPVTKPRDMYEPDLHIDTLKARNFR